LQSQLLRRQRKEDHKFKVSIGKVSETLPQNQNTNKKAGGMAQEVVQHLPRMHKDLGSVPVLKNKEEKEGKSRPWR
jgi:hypothetical protein